MAEKRLGRGLDYLLSRTRVVEGSESSTQASEPQVVAPMESPRTLPISSIRPNPFQPRREFTPEALSELTESIRVHGVLQPVVVRRASEGEAYELVAGERRWRAATAAGLSEIPVSIREVPDDSLLALALVENLQRENLNPIETAEAYHRLLSVEGTTQEEVARVVGKSRVSIANGLRLLDLPEDLKQKVATGVLSAGHARALLMVGDADAMRTLAMRIVENGLSVREAERAARGEEVPVSTQPPTLPPGGGPRRPRSSHLEEVEDRLRKSLGTRVTVKPGRGKRGKIVLYYASLEDFDRLFEILVGSESDRPVEPAPDTKYF